MKQEDLINKKALLQWFVLIILLLYPFRTQQALGADFDVPSVYGTIQAAIDAAMIDVTPDGETHVIRVAKSTAPYYENLVVEPSDYGGYYNLIIQGGWASDFSSKDSNPETTVIDGNQQGTVVTIDNMYSDLTLILESFTIQNGNNADTGKGGGIYINARSMNWKDLITIRNNIIRNNIVGSENGRGGGIYGTSSSIFAHRYEILITGNKIHGNEVQSKLGGGGACFSISGRDQPYPEPGLTFSNNQVYDNKVVFPDQGSGGGIHVFMMKNASAVIKDNDIHNNTSSNNEGGVYLSSLATSTISFAGNRISQNTAAADNGGFSAVAWDDSRIALENNAVYSNLAVTKNGGGRISAYDSSRIYLSHGFILDNTAESVGGVSLFGSDNSTLFVINNLIAGNGADGGETGGTYVNIAKQGELLFNNNTIADNFSTENYSGGHMYVGGFGDPLAHITALNNIIWNNSNAADDDHSFFISGEAASVEISYSDYDEIASYSPWSGTNNIQQDPLFTPGPPGVVGDENYYLSHTLSGQSEDSLCIDAGNESAGLAGLDMQTTRTDQVTDSNTVDMGFHYPLTAIEDIPGDGDRDGDVDGRDLSGFTAAYPSSPGDSNYDPAFDLDGIPGIGAGDLEIFTQHFGT